MNLYFPSSHSRKTLRFALILSIIVTFTVSSTTFARKKAAPSRNKASRSEGRSHKGGKQSAGARRNSRRSGHVARNSRRGRRSQSTARNVRQQRKLVAREQASSLKALERKLRRPLTKRERVAELRRVESRHRRDSAAARRRAEAARQAAIARQRALDKAMRDEVQTLISRDDTTGEDMDVRRAAVNALGYHAGTVVVMDPMTGKVYSIVNQEWAMRRGFKPCSTIKLVTRSCRFGREGNRSEPTPRLFLRATTSILLTLWPIRIIPTFNKWEARSDSTR